MIFGEFRRWLNNLSRNTRGRAAGRKRARSARPGLEVLEDRAVPAVVLTVVNDNWAFVADNGDNMLSVGDTIRNDNDTINRGALTCVYGVDGFGTVTTGQFTSSVLGAATINDAIANTVSSGTVEALEGTYVENVVVNQSVTLAGAGQGVSIVRPAISSITGNPLTGSAIILVQSSDVQIAGFTLDGDNTALTSGVIRGGADIDATAGIVTAYNVSEHYNNLEIDHVTVQNIYLRGIQARMTGTINIHDNVVDNVQGDVDLSIGIFNRNGGGIISGNIVSRTADAISANWSQGTQFLNNTITLSQAGIHTDNSRGAGGTSTDLIEGNSVSLGARMGTPASYGIWAFMPYQNVTIRNNTVSGVDIGISAYGQGSATGTVTIDHNSVDLGDTAGSIGVDISTTIPFGFDFSAHVSASLINGNTVSNAATGVSIHQDAGFVASVNITSTTFTGNHFDIVNQSAGTLTPAGNNVFDGVTLSSATTAQLFAIADKIVDAIDVPGYGLVRLKAGNIYVTPNSFAPTATDNDYTRIQRALDAAENGDTIHLRGTFDWREANAKASWALGNDGIAGTDDDYSILVRDNLDGVTLKADTLGDARILGPGDVASVNQEGFLVFWGPHNQNWTIANLEIFDFDLGIGMFTTSGDAFLGTTITGNHIRVAADLNGVDAPDDASQNIGIHYSFGKNQTISDNVIEIPGAGVSHATAGDLSTPAARSRYSSTVGMQSNTSAGSYDGLEITGNEIRVLNFTAANRERIIGFWDNAHGHLSDIVVSNNKFLNLDPDNDSSLNLQQAFWVTSHSGAATTVTYSGNYVEGANIGFKWLGDPEYTGQNFSAHQAVRLWGNTLVGNNTGVLIQSGGAANLFQNTITGSGLGGAVNVVNGRLIGVEQNDFSGGAGDAIVLDVNSSVAGGIFNNNLATTGLGIRHNGAGGVNASGNWWGSSTGPTGLSGPVDYSPWLTTGADVSTDPGFQGDFSKLTVNATSPRYTGQIPGNLQEGIDQVTAGGTVRAMAGTYYENLTIHKSLSLLGPNDAVNPNTGTRGPEAVIMPLTSDPNPFSVTAVNVVYVDASNVTIKGFAIAGDNPTLTSGILVNGVDVDACEGIAAYGGVGNITVENNIIRDTSYAGIDFYNYFNDGGATSDNYIRNNQITNVGHIPYGFGIGVLLYNNFYADVTHNVMTGVRVGVQTGNFSQANPGTTGSISDNQIASTRRGIFHNLHYLNASPFTISNNTLTVQNEDGAARWDGIMLSAIGGSVDAIVRDNVIEATDVTQTTVGYQVWGDTTSAELTIEGGSVTGADYGVWVNNFDGYGPSNGGSTAVTVRGVRISGASKAGVYVKDNLLNTNSATVAATVIDSSITSSAIGVLVEGPDASASISGTNFDGATDNATDVRVESTAGAVTFGAGNAFAGDTYYIDNRTAQPYDLSANGTTFDQANNFRIEDRMHHKVDDLSLGLVTWVAGNVYATAPGTGAADTDSDIQRGIAASADGKTVNVEAGTYHQAIDADDGKATTLAAAGTGTGQVILTGHLWLGSEDTLAFEVKGSTAGSEYDQWVAPEVNLGDPGTQLAVDLGSYTPPLGSVFTLLDSAAVIGGFAGLPDGTVQTIDGHPFYLNYSDDSGDFTLLRNLPPVADGNGPYTVFEGQALTLDGSATTDPDSNDPAEDRIYQWYINGQDVGTGETLVVNWSKLVAVGVNDGPTSSPPTVRLVVTDAAGLSSEYLTTLGVYNAPPTVAVSGPASVEEGTLYTLTLDTPSDPGDDTIGVYRVFWGDGTVDTYFGTPPATATHTYTDGPNPYTVTVDATDEDGTYTVGAITVTVTAPNSAPVAQNDSYTVNEDGSLIVAANGVLTNDSDADGDARKAVRVSGPTHGILTLNEDGSFTYTPAANFHGTDSFTYLANDGTADSDVVTVTIQVLPVNDAPVATGTSVPTDEDTPVSGSVRGTDVEGDTLIYAVLDGPAHGTVVMKSDGTFTYTPDADYNGTDSFTFKANDRDLDSAPATVNITVVALNDAPVLSGVPSAVTINEEESYTFRATARDGDLPAQTLTFSLVGAPAGAAIDPTSGVFTWTPTEAQNGTHAFKVRVSDGGTSTDAEITLTVREVNVAPMVSGVPSAVTINEEELYTFTATASDHDNTGQTLTFSLVGAPAGAAIDPTSGVFTWTPTEAQGAGAYPFTVRVSDGVTFTDANITLTVREVNVAPVGNADSIEVSEGGTVTALVSGASSVLANDSDHDLLANTLISVVVNQPSHGTLNLNADGTFSYAHDGGETTSDSFSYKVFDGTAYSAEVTVAITIDPVNDAPAVVTDSVTASAPSGNVPASGTAVPDTAGVFDPSSAVWHLRNSSGFPDAGSIHYGAPGWLPVVGDWDGDGTTTIGVVDPTTNTWYLRNSNTPGAPDVTPFRYGALGWIPVVGDWDGDGTTTIGVVDPTTNTWYLRNSNGPGAPDITPFRYGGPGWTPVVGDWDGNGTTTIGVVEPTTMTWYLKNSNAHGAPDLTPFRYGAPGWVPVAGDWNGDGVTSIGVFDPTGQFGQPPATWYLKSGNSSVAPAIAPFAYGMANWAPVAGDWNSPALPLRAAGTAPASAATAALTDGQLQAAVAAALTRLSRAGVSQTAVQRLASAQYALGRLSDGQLALAYGAANAVVIDPTASGRGWFVDPTPLRDEEFATAGALRGSAAEGKMDLLSAVLHEMGHLAGQADSAAGGEDLMAAALPAGTRHADGLDRVFARWSDE